MLILGLETSCDETAVALVEAKGDLPAEEAGRFVIHQNLISSQIKIHRKYGGVVPEVAARRHVEVIIPLLKKALGVKEGEQVKKQEIKEIKKIKDIGKEIDVIAVTAGPGLLTSLLVGVETARTLSYLWKKPLVAVNHLEGHIYANWLSSCHSGLDPESRKQQMLDSRSPIVVGDKSPIVVEDKLCGNDKQKPPISNFQFPNQFPILCLIVSGGHTELILMKDHLKYKLIGQTRDDAAGECFDKVGKMLGLPYPGGPEVAKLAGRGNPQAINFPRPMMDSSDFDFSFSGLKTAVLYYLQSHKAIKPYSHKALRLYGFTADISASFQQAVVDVLVAKTLRAAEKFCAKTILLGGGVAANQHLQKAMTEAVNQQLPNTKYFILNTKYCSDNAAMIAAAGYFRAAKKNFIPWQKLEVNPNWELA